MAEIKNGIRLTGERSFSTGAVRDANTDKGRFDLLSPIFLKRLAQHTQRGALNRGERNWGKGMDVSSVLDSAIRHLYAFIEGDRIEGHLSSAAWNIMVTIHVLEMIDRDLMDDELDNLPDYTGKVSEPEYVPVKPES